MKALVTGATGFVGASVVRALLAAGHDVRVLVRRSSSWTNMDGIRAEAVVGDLLEPPSLRRALEGCDALFHVAGAYALWVRDPRLLYRTNVDGTRAILEAARDLGTRRIVVTSSVAVLRPPAGGDAPSDERSEPASVSEVVGHYKRSKYLTDLVVRDFVERHGLPVMSVLPSAPIGPGDIRPTPTGAIVLDFLAGRMPAYVDTGLNIIDIDDCGRGHILAWERGRPGERYILGNENLTLRAILHQLASLTGLPAPRLRLPWSVAWSYSLAGEALARITGRPPRAPLDAVRMARFHMFFSAGKAVRELGLPQRPAREALRRAALWFCEHGYVLPRLRDALLDRLRAAEPRTLPVAPVAPRAPSLAPIAGAPVLEPVPIS